jgi:hypothetical protein
MLADLLAAHPTVTHDRVPLPGRKEQEMERRCAEAGAPWDPIELRRTPAVPSVRSATSGTLACTRERRSAARAQMTARARVSWDVTAQVNCFEPLPSYVVSCTGRVASQITVARNTKQPKPRIAVRARSVCSLVLIPAKKSDEAKSTTASM